MYILLWISIILNVYLLFLLSKKSKICIMIKNITRGFRNFICAKNIGIVIDYRSEEKGAYVYHGRILHRKIGRYFNFSFNCEREEIDYDNTYFENCLLYNERKYIKNELRILTDEYYDEHDT